MTAQPRRRVALFVTCIVDQIYPDIGFAAAELLERQGAEVHVPRGLTCCGQMAFNAGFRDDAYAVAGRTIEILRNQGDVVLPSGSCGAMIRHLYHELFHGSRHAAAAKELASRTYELSEYLVDVLGVTDVGARYNGVIAFHDARCLITSLARGSSPCQEVTNAVASAVCSQSSNIRSPKRCCTVN
jgi:L-lactate dehydrogenase complex protein LldE